jgi:hypothetical protein
LVPAIVLPTLALAFFLSPIGLAIFGHSYVIGALGPLRWLILAALVSMPLSVLGAILVVAKKSLMTTIANAVDAIVVISLLELWAKNDSEIAVSWTVGEFGNIMLFALFAFLALREVNWRWEDLGGTQAEPTADPLLRGLSTTGQLQGLAKLMAIAEQQRTSQMYDMWMRGPSATGQVTTGGSPHENAPGAPARTGRHRKHPARHLPRRQRTQFPSPTAERRRGS